MIIPTETQLSLVNMLWRRKWDVTGIFNVKIVYMLQVLYIMYKCMHVLYTLLFIHMTSDSTHFSWLGLLMFHYEATAWVQTVESNRM